jgi:hypothetical protein
MQVHPGALHRRLGGGDLLDGTNRHDYWAGEYQIGEV